MTEVKRPGAPGGPGTASTTPRDPSGAPTVRFRRLESNPDLPLPARATPHAAGYDVRAAADVELAAGQIALVPTGLVMELPEGIECQVRPRSGLALKHGITLPNSPGTIDPDYRGELGIIVQNLGRESFKVARGDRIAQLVFARFEMPAIEEALGLADTARGSGGFGSTGRG